MSDSRVDVRVPVMVNEAGVERIRKGDGRVWDRDLSWIEGEPQNGSVVELLSPKGRFLALGLYSAFSRLRIRVISLNKQERIDAAFWSRRFHYALSYRETVLSKEEFGAARLIFGEADGFPGLTVDRYGEVLVVQNLSFPLEQRKDLLYPLLLDACSEHGIQVRALYEKNALALREKEGLVAEEGFYTGDPRLTVVEPAEIWIEENGLRFWVPYGVGQKTGYYLDQKRNRRYFASVAKGKRVLECFSNSGSFGLNALAAGADFVLAVDSSELALEAAKRNREANGFDESRHACLRADCKQLLSALKEGRLGPDWDFARSCGPFDLMLLDPPAFAKKRQDERAAMRAYQELNQAAMQVLPRGGYLASCTCSHFASPAVFREMLETAARSVSRSLKLLMVQGPSPDHPILMGQAESSYLQFYLMQVI